MSFWVDISNAADHKVGPGPIITGVKWRYTQRLSRAGEWSLEVPYGEPRLAHATYKRKVACWVQVGEQALWGGSGAIEKIAYSEKSGTIVLSGNDTLYDLARDTLRLELNSDSPYLGSGLYGQIMAAASTTWYYSVFGTTPNMTVRFVDESILNALTTVTNKTGQMFRLNPPLYLLGVPAPRSILIFSAVEPSGILATNMADDLAIERNPNACSITDIDRVGDVSGLVNLVKPYGSGTGSARLTTAAATVWPDGSGSNTQYETVDAIGRTHRFLVDQVQNFVLDITSFTQYGQYSGQVQYKDIAPITNSNGDMAAAANALLAAAVQYLLDSSVPQEHYNIGIAGLRKQVYPGQSIHVQAVKLRDGQRPINIDTDLIIQEVTTEIDANGVRTVGLTVATTSEFAQTDAQVLVREIQKSLAYQAHPQMGPTDPVICYREDIDGNFGATFPFWISNATTQVNSVIARFKLEQLRSTVKSVGTTINPTVPLPVHKHDVTTSDHTHPIPNHQHNIQFPPVSGGFPVQVFSGGGSPDFGSIGANGAPHDIFVNTNSSSGATTATARGGQTITSENNPADTTFELDLSDAIKAQYGIYVDPTAAYTVDQLLWALNSSVISTTPKSIGFGWYELDITSLVADTLTGRPLQAANTLSVAVNPGFVVANKNVRVTAQIEIRKVIQSIAAVPATVVSAAADTADPFARPPSTATFDADTLDGFDSTAFVKVSDYDPADVIAKIITVDGPGSGLDADTLDGLDSTDFAAASHTQAASTITDFTEAAQDVIGAMLVDSATIDFTYDDTAGTETASIIDGSVTFAKMQTIATDRLIGRDTAGTGAPEPIALGASLEFGGSGTIQRAALTGDVTATANSNATTIAANAVTNAKLAQMTAATVKGRASGAGTGDPVDLTADQVAAIVNAATGLGSTWTALPYTTGATTWADFVTGGHQVGQYKKFGDLVFLRGLVKRTSGSGTTIATLPSGYRPASYVQLYNALTDGGAVRVDVNTDGTITLPGGGSPAWISLLLPPFSVL